MFIPITHFRDADVGRLLDTLNRFFSDSPVGFEFYQGEPPERTKSNGRDINTIKSLNRKGLADAFNVFIVWGVYPAAGTPPEDLLKYPLVDGGTVGAKAMEKDKYAIITAFALWAGLLAVDGAGCEGTKDGLDFAPVAFPVFGCPKNRDTCPGDGRNDRKSTWASSLGGLSLIPFVPSPRQRSV